MADITEILSQYNLTLFEYLEKLDLPNISTNLFEIRETINTLSGQMTTLSQNVSLNNSKITELYALDSNTTQQLELLADLISSLRSDISSLNQQVQFLSDEVQTDFQPQLNTLKASITAHTLQLTVLTNTVNSHDTDLKQLRPDVNHVLQVVGNSNFQYVVSASDRPFIRYSFPGGRPHVGKSVYCSEYYYTGGTPNFIYITIYMFNPTRTIAPTQNMPIICGAPYKITGSNIVQTNEQVVFYPLST